jgi:hypothetical protein
MLKTAAYDTTTQLILAPHTDKTGNDEAFPVYKNYRKQSTLKTAS